MTREQKLEAALRFVHDDSGFRDLEPHTLVAVLNALATPPDADTRVVSVADVLTAAVDEYLLQHIMETDWHRSGRHNAVRGLMVRIGLYPLLDQAIEELLSRAIIEGKDQ